MLDKPVKSNKKIALHMDYMKVLSLTGKNYIQLYINSMHSRNAIAKMDSCDKILSHVEITFSKKTIW